jgi:hypothetical protein
MRMFRDVGSKVTEGVKHFKTYNMQPVKEEKDNIDNLIEKVENEIQELEQERY